MYLSVHTHHCRHTQPLTDTCVCTTHPAGTSSPTCPILGSLRVPRILHKPISVNICSLSALKTPHSQACRANTEFPIVCSFSGPRGGCGPGWGSWPAGSAGCRASGRRPSLGEVGRRGGQARARGAPPNPAGARGPRVHLSSHYCNKSGLHYMKGKMNYRR